MANFFLDNKDMQYHLKHPLMKKIVALKEKNFEEKDNILSDTHLILPENRKITRINKENNDNESGKKLTKTMNSSINK